LSQITRLTDRQTDGRTDRILIARPRLHFMQRGKNHIAQPKAKATYLIMLVNFIDLFKSVLRQ